MITNKKHNEIVKALEERITFYTNLAYIVERLTEKTLHASSCLTFNGIDNMTWHFPDNVAQYVDDIVLGGKVIKQEGTKAIVIGLDGTVKEGLTKKKPRDGYTYVLVEVHE